MTDVARPADDSADPVPPGMLAIFARARQLSDEMIADNNELDVAWQSGDPLKAIRAMQKRTREQVDKMKQEAKQETGYGRPADAADDMAADAMG